MENWDEVRTAFQVARLGTVSGAAEVLGVHHATVIRHIDALEDRVGVKLFQRHARGYTATEAGLDLLRVAKATDDQFAQLAGRLKGQGDAVTGELIVTSLAGLSPLLTPVLVAFQQENPGLSIRFLTDLRLFRLEYGEAHVAIRAGAPPEQPDNVVQPFIQLPVALVATAGYIARRGRPAGLDDLKNHDFVGPDSGETRAPYYRWLADYITPQQVVYRASDDQVLRDSILSGAGIGFLPVWDVAKHSDLVEVLPRDPAWIAPFWIVTHVDLHRTAKVQAFLKFLKAAAKGWAC